MKSSNKIVPCRHYVILAREASTGVILRRGPSKWFQIIKWDTATDTFEHGQWFHGRIYEDRCDLSPDGTKLVYFAANYANHDERVGIAWTGVSKVPYLTALAFFPQGYSINHGGGLFISNTEVRLHSEPAPGTNTVFAHEGRCPSELKVTAFGSLENTMNALALRQKRNGWKNGKEKPHPQKPLTLLTGASSLEHMATGRSFIVRDTKRNLQIPLNRAVWADWDKQGRLVYAQGGRLFVGEFDGSGRIEPREIADFNSHKPERVETPDWAKVW
jgi:hypothetical protein